MEHLLADGAALLQVVLIDLALAGDNAVAVGLAAAALPAAQQKRVIFWGIMLALVLRIAFATGVKALLAIKGILLFGGLLLLWVAWRMWSDLQKHQPVQVMDPVAGEHMAEGIASEGKPPTTFGRALLTIVVADVSMSLDNVIAVAGVARHSADWILWFGLVLAVGLMGIAASVIAKVIERYQWIAVVGVIIIVFAGTRMIWEDAHMFLPNIIPPMPGFLGAPHPPA
jgi:YjbE family integral membrane protein